MFIRCYGPLARYVKLRVALAPECLERFFFRHHGLAILTCIMARAFEAGGRENDPGILGNPRNPQFYVSDKRSIPHLKCV